MGYDVPQADRLDLVRRVLTQLNIGVTASDAVAANAHIAKRYARYAIHACKVLGLIDESMSITDAGSEVLRTKVRSSEERQLLVAQIEAGPLRPLAQHFLGVVEPGRLPLAQAIIEESGMSLSTAVRRASTLIAWRRYLLQEGSQLDLLYTEYGEPTGVGFDAPSSEQRGRTREPNPVDVPDSLNLPTLADASEAPSGLEASQEARQQQDQPVQPESTDATRSEVSPQQLILSEPDLKFLRNQTQRGRLLLFSGAGFSLSARDLQGEHLPLGWQFRNELWNLCYPNEEDDEASTLQDLFERAASRNKRALNGLLERRFSVDSSSLPEWFKTWHEFSWSKVYTLNVDDLHEACDRRFSLPREINSVSALRRDRLREGRLNVIHLNGRAIDGVDDVTFSEEQYAERLAAEEVHYAQLASELLTHPTIFVGTPINEPLFWQHIRLRRTHLDGTPELRPRSFLVSPKLSRARVDKLRDFNIVWVKSDAEGFTKTLEGFKNDAALGLAEIRHQNDAKDRSVSGVPDLLRSDRGRAEFYLGQEPTWNDVQVGRAVPRQIEKGLIKAADTRLQKSHDLQPTKILIAVGTAGCGKTTTLMRAALELESRGHRVGWASGSATSPRDLMRHYRDSEVAHDVLVLDNASHFGSQLAPTLSDLTKSDKLRLIILATRTYGLRWLEVEAAKGLDTSSHTFGPLTDQEISAIVDALEREKRLGSLRGLSRSERITAFRESAKRQILVAMLEATSGESFEERVYSEWHQLPDVQRYVYALVGLATWQGYGLRREEIVLGVGSSPSTLAAIDRLRRDHLLVTDRNGSYLARHTVIGEVLTSEIASRGTQIDRVIVSLCRALAVQSGTGRGQARRRRRVLRNILNHDWLFRLSGALEPARNVYAQLEDPLNDEHHFWLQRGCLELHCGNIRFAENFLEQARGINSGDPLVVTSYAHMRLRKAICAPTAPSAQTDVDIALDELRGVISQHGPGKGHAAHIFGSQVIGWLPKSKLSGRPRKALLQEARTFVAAALKDNPRSTQLKQLETDIEREKWRPV